MHFKKDRKRSDSLSTPSASLTSSQSSEAGSYRASISDLPPPPQQQAPQPLQQSYQGPSLAASGRRPSFQMQPVQQAKSGLKAAETFEADDSCSPGGEEEGNANKSHSTDFEDDDSFWFFWFFFSFSNGMTMMMTLIFFTWFLNFFKKWKDKYYFICEKI